MILRARTFMASQSFLSEKLLIRIGLAAVALIIGFLFLYRLDVYPSPNFDEGAYINVASNFATKGIYAESSSDGYRFNGAVVSTGPTVILPIALLFKLFGTQVVLARLVMVAYGLLMFAAIYALCYKLGGMRYAILVTVLAFFGWGSQLPYAPTTYMFRNVMGEGPALALLFAGLWLWMQSESQNLLKLLIVGVLFGFVCITKTQFALFLLPTLLIAWIADMIIAHKRNWLYYVIPGIIAGVIFAGWTYYSWYLLGANMRNPQADIATLRTAGLNSYFVLSPDTNFTNFTSLGYGFGYAGLYVPALLLGLYYALRRDLTGSRWRVFSLLVLGSGALFILSIGWAKNAYPTLVIASLFVGRLILDLIDFAHVHWHDFRALLPERQRALTPKVVTILLAGFVVLLLGVPLMRAFYDVGWAGTNAPYKVAAYLDQNVPKQDVIETWDKELINLTDHTFHLPPQAVETLRNEAVRGVGAPASDFYNFHDYVDPDYVIIGPSSRTNGVYPADRLTNYTLATTIGDYQIYRKQTSVPPKSGS